MDHKRCSSCGGASPVEAQFCVECGATLSVATGATQKLPVLRCGSCHVVLPPYARFCPLCGHTIGAKPAPALVQPAPVLVRPQLAPPVAVPMPRTAPTRSTAPVRRQRQSSRPINPWLLLFGLMFLAPLLGPIFLPVFVFVVLMSGVFGKRAVKQRAFGAGKALFLIGLVYLLVNGTVWPYILPLALLAFVVGKLLD